MDGDAAPSRVGLSIHQDNDANNLPQRIVQHHTSSLSNGLVMNNYIQYMQCWLATAASTTDYPTFNISRAISSPFKLYMPIAI